MRSGKPWSIFFLATLTFLGTAHLLRAGGQRGEGRSTRAADRTLRLVVGPAQAEPRATGDGGILLPVETVRRPIEPLVARLIGKCKGVRLAPPTTGQTDLTMRIDVTAVALARNYTSTTAAANHRLNVGVPRYSGARISGRISLESQTAPTMSVAFGSEVTPAPEIAGLTYRSPIDAPFEQAMSDAGEAPHQVANTSSSLVSGLLVTVGELCGADVLLAVRSDPAWRYREHVWAAFPKLRDTRVIDSLAVLLDGADASVAQKAAEALGATANPRAFEPLLGALVRQRRGGRARAGTSCAAARALGRLGDPRATDSLLAALKGEHGCWSAAAAALGDLRSRRAVEPLLAALQDERHPDREVAAEALGKIGDIRAVDPLIELVNRGIPLDSDSLSASAAAALGQLGDRRALEPLLAALKSQNRYGLNRSAATALGKLSDKSVIPAMKTVLSEVGSADPSFQSDLQAAINLLTVGPSRDKDSRK